MKSVLRPEACAICGQPLRYEPAWDAPGGWIALCVNRDCEQHGRAFEFPVFDVVPHTMAALLRRRVG